MWELAGDPTRPPHRIPSPAEVRADLLARREAEARALAGLGAAELARRGRAALAAGDADAAVRLLDASFQASGRALAGVRPGADGPAGDQALLATLDAHRRVMEELVALREARRQGYAVIGAARALRATLGDLVERSQVGAPAPMAPGGAAPPPLRQGLFGAWLEVTRALRNAFAAHATPAAVGRLEAETLALAERAFGAGSPEAERARSLFD
jgi:hypothetical protein